jgi:hypothetical protein
MSPVPPCVGGGRNPVRRRAMNWDTIAGGWKQFTGKVEEK